MHTNKMGKQNCFHMQEESMSLVIHAVVVWMRRTLIGLYMGILGTLGERLGGVALLEKMHHWE